MPMKLLLASIDDLPDPIKALYKKTDDGKFALDVEDDGAKAKLDEFRSNNRDLKEQLKAALEKIDTFKDIDPGKYKELLSKLQSDEEKKLLKDGNVEEVIRLRVEALKREQAEQISAKDKIIAKLEADTKQAVSDRDTYIIDSELRKAVDHPELGFQSGVADLVRRQVLEEFILKDGRVIGAKKDGTIIYGKNGEPKTLGEFLADVAKERPYLVKPSNGSGANNNGGHQNGAKTIKRVEFEKLEHGARASKMKEGVTVID